MENHRTLENMSLEPFCKQVHQNFWMLHYLQPLTLGNMLTIYSGKHVKQGQNNVNRALEVV